MVLVLVYPRTDTFGLVFVLAQNRTEHAASFALVWSIIYFLGGRWNQKAITEPKTKNEKPKDENRKPNQNPNLKLKN